MTLKLVAVTAALVFFTLAAQAESEGGGNPFPFRAPGASFTSSVARPPDTGAEAYPNLAGRPAQTATVGGPDSVPMTGSESTVQTANGLPRGFAEGTAAYAQAQSVQRYFAAAAERRAVSAQRSAGEHS